MALQGWILLGLSAAAGAVFGARALPVPVIYVAGFYMARGGEGAFTNHSGSGDNLAALGFLSAAIWCAIGVLAFGVGVLGRTLVQKRRT